MGAIKTGWDFFQDQILGMHWLKDLIGNLLVKAGMGESRFLIFRVIFRRREVRRLWEDSMVSGRILSGHCLEQ